MLHVLPCFTGVWFAELHQHQSEGTRFRGRRPRDVYIISRWTWYWWHGLIRNLQSQQFLHNANTGTRDTPTRSAFALNSIVIVNNAFLLEFFVMSRLKHCSTFAARRSTCKDTFSRCKQMQYRSAVANFERR